MIITSTMTLLPARAEETMLPQERPTTTKESVGGCDQNVSVVIPGRPFIDVSLDSFRPTGASRGPLAVEVRHLMRGLDQKLSTMF